MTRIGAPGSSAAAHTIAHEIGHAFDFIPLRSAIERERFAVAEFNRTFGRYETSPGSGQYQLPKNQQDSWDKHSQKVAALRQAREAARTLSGSRWQLRPDSREFEFVDPDGADESVGEFRQAAGMDGPVRISKYSEKDWQEYFAECFSLYVLDPQSLEWLRSNIFQYFAKHFPR
jgi:hypothetical protein